MNKKYKKYINYIARDIQVPYLKSLEPYGLKQDGIDLVLSKVFNQPVNYKNYLSCHRVFDIDNNELYLEDDDGYWDKREYDAQGNLIYYEDDDGYWDKREYDDQGNLIYYEDSNGRIIDNRI